MATLRDLLASMPPDQREGFVQQLYERRARVLDDQRKGKVLGSTTRFAKGVGAGLANAAWGAVTLPAAVTNAVGMTDVPIKPLFGSGIGALSDDPLLSGNAYRLGEFGGFLGSFFIGAGEAKAGASALSKVARWNPIARGAEVGGGAAAKLAERVGLKHQLLKQAAGGAGSLAAGEFIATPGSLSERKDRAIGAIPAGAVFGAFHATRGVRDAQGLHTSPASIAKATKGVSVAEAVKSGLVKQESIFSFVPRATARGAAAGAILGHGSPVEITGNPRLDSIIFNAGFFGGSAIAHRGTVPHPERAKAVETTDAKRQKTAEQLEPGISTERESFVMMEHPDILARRLSPGEVEHTVETFGGGLASEARQRQLRVVGEDTVSGRLIVVDPTTGKPTTLDPRAVRVERPLTLRERQASQARLFEEANDIPLPPEPPGVEIVTELNRAAPGQTRFDFDRPVVEEGGVLVPAPRPAPYVIPDPGARPTRQGNLFGPADTAPHRPPEIDLRDPIAKGELEARFETAAELLETVPLPTDVRVVDTPFGPKIELPPDKQSPQYKMFDTLQRVTARANVNPEAKRNRPDPIEVEEHTKNELGSGSGSLLNWPVAADVRERLDPVLFPEGEPAPSLVRKVFSRLAQMWADGFNQDYNTALGERLMQPLKDIVLEDIQAVSPLIRVDGDAPVRIVIKHTPDKRDFVAFWSGRSRLITIDPRYFAEKQLDRRLTLIHELAHDRTLLFDQGLAKLDNPGLMVKLLDRMGFSGFWLERMPLTKDIYEAARNGDAKASQAIQDVRDERMWQRAATTARVLERLGIGRPNLDPTRDVRQGELFGSPPRAEPTAEVQPEHVFGFTTRLIKSIKPRRPNQPVPENEPRTYYKLSLLDTNDRIRIIDLQTGEVRTSTDATGDVSLGHINESNIKVLRKIYLDQRDAPYTRSTRLHEVEHPDYGLHYIPLTETNMSTTRRTQQAVFEGIDKQFGTTGDAIFINPHPDYLNEFLPSGYAPIAGRYYGYTNPAEFMAELAVEYYRYNGNTAVLDAQFPGISLFLERVFANNAAGLRAQATHNARSAQMELLPAPKLKVEVDVGGSIHEVRELEFSRERALETAEMMAEAMPSTPRGPESSGPPKATVRSAESERGGPEVRIPASAKEVTEAQWGEHVRGFGAILNDPTSSTLRTAAEKKAGKAKAEVRSRADGSLITEWDTMVDSRAGKDNDAARYHIEGAMQDAIDLMLQRIDPATSKPYTRTPNIGQMLQSLKDVANRAARDYKEQTEGSLRDAETSLSNLEREGMTGLNDRGIENRAVESETPESAAIARENVSSRAAGFDFLREQLAGLRPGSLSYEQIKDQIYRAVPKDAADAIWRELTGQGEPVAEPPVAEPPAKPRRSKPKPPKEEPTAVEREPEVVAPEADTPAIVISTPKELRGADLNTRRVHWLNQAFADGLTSFEAATRNWKAWQRMAVLMTYGPYYKDAAGKPLFPAPGFTKAGTPKRRTAKEIGRHVGMVSKKQDGTIVKSASVAQWLASGFMEPVARSPHDPTTKRGGKGSQRRSPEAETLEQALGEGATPMAEALEAAFWQRVEANGGKIPNLMHERTKDVKVEELTYTDPVTGDVWRADMTLAEMSDAIAKRVAAEREAGVVDAADLTDKPTPESPVQQAANDALNGVVSSTTDTVLRFVAGDASASSTVSTTFAPKERKPSATRRLRRSREQILEDLTKKGSPATREYAKRLLATSKMYQHGMKLEHFIELTPTERIKHVLWSLSQAANGKHYTAALRKYADFYAQAGVEVPNFQAVAAAKGHKERVQLVNNAERPNFVQIEVVPGNLGARPHYRLTYEDSGRVVEAKDVGTLALLLDLRTEQIRNAPELVPEATGVTLDLKGGGPRPPGPPEKPGVADAESGGEPPGHKQAIERGIAASLFQSLRSPREWAYTFARKMNDPEVATVVNSLIGATSRMYAQRQRWLRRLNRKRRELGVDLKRGDILGKAMATIDDGAMKVYEATQSLDATRNWVAKNEADIYEAHGLTGAEVSYLNWVRSHYLDRLANVFGLGDRKWPGYFPRLRKRTIGQRGMEDTAALTSRSHDFFAEYERKGLELDARNTDLWQVLEAYTGSGFRAKFIGSRAGNTGLIDQLNDILLRYSPTDAQGNKLSTPPSWLAPLLQVKRAALGVTDPRRADVLDRRDARIQRRLDWAERLADKHDAKSYPLHEVVAGLLRSRASRLGAELQRRDSMLLADYFLSLNRSRTFGLHAMRSIRHVTQSWFTTLPRVGPKVFFEVVAEMSTPQGFKRITKRAIAAGAIKTPFEVDVSPQGDFSNQKFSAKVMRGVDSLSRGYSWLDRWERGIAFEAQRRKFSRAAAEFKNHQNLEQLRVDSGASMLHPMIWRQLEPLVKRGNFAAAERMIANAMVDHSIFDYTRANAPKWAAGVWGKVLGQYGRWPLNMVENFKGMLKYGTYQQRAQVLATYAAVAAAVYGMGQAFGVQTGDWIPFIHAVNYSGGPATGLMMTGLDLLSGDEMTKQRIYNDFSYDPTKFVLGGLFRQIMPAGDVLEALAAEANHTRREGLMGVIDKANLGNARQRRLFGVNFQPAWDIKTDDSLMGRHEGQLITLRRLAGFRPSHDPPHRKPMLKEAVLKAPGLGDAIGLAGDVVGSVADFSPASAAAFQRRAQRANRVPPTPPFERLR